ncbi:MAG: lasso peptide [Calothrix sp. FI2-JRJ7]|jgi:hypothetical protein|nr:lasso peptide [Calothrix sp. FI2-JRJ7]
MKKQYVAPELTVHGNAAEITQIVGGAQRTDFAFQNGQQVSGGNDLGSRDVDVSNIR